MGRIRFSFLESSLAVLYINFDVSTMLSDAIDAVDAFDPVRE
jgi:hypothetical protein